jgi:putative transposase
MIQFVAQRMMEMNAESLCAAAYGERSPERLNSRNGYRERLWETRAGSIDLKIPKLRKGSYFPGFLEPRRTAEKALAAVLRRSPRARVGRGAPFAPRSLRCHPGR